MGITYRKSKKLGNGVRLNVGKKSVGLSAGVKGARVSMNSKGQSRINLSIPGTGLRFQKTISGGGIFVLFANITIWFFKAAFILIWWMLKFIIWFWYMLFLYSFKSLRYLVLKIQEAMRNKNSKE